MKKILKINKKWSKVYDYAWLWRDKIPVKTFEYFICKKIRMIEKVNDSQLKKFQEFYNFFSFHDASTAIMKFISKFHGLKLQPIVIERTEKCFSLPAKILASLASIILTIPTWNIISVVDSLGIILKIASIQLSSWT